MHGVTSHDSRGKGSLVTVMAVTKPLTRSEHCAALPLTAESRLCSICREQAPASAPLLAAVIPLQ